MEGFLWTKAREQAAKLVAEDKQPDTEIAAAVGVTKITLERWKRHPDFAARVSQIVEAYRKRILSTGIADRVNRVKRLDEDWQRMQALKAARAAEMGPKEPGGEPEVAGGETGLLVRDEKMIGGGENAQHVTVYKFDAALLSELRATEKQAAQEVGQWAERHEVSGPNGGPMEISLSAAIDKVYGDSDPPNPS